jgi:hypothetical protein
VELFTSLCDLAALWFVTLGTLCSDRKYMEKNKMLFIHIGATGKTIPDCKDHRFIQRLCSGQNKELESVRHMWKRC